IPTAPSVAKATVVAGGAVGAGLLGRAFGGLAPPALNAGLTANLRVGELFAGNGVATLLTVCFAAAGIAGVACLVAGILAFVRLRAPWWLLFAALCTVHVAAAAIVGVAWHALATLLAAGLPIDGADQDRVTTSFLWWRLSWPELAKMLAALWLQTMLRSRSVYAAFTREAGGPLRGDEVLEDLRTGGRDPLHRRSVYASGLAHLVVIVLIPWLMQLDGCVEPYRVPKGSGNPVVAMVKMVKPKKQKKKKSLTLRPNSAVVFEVPDLDNSEADEEMKEMTELTYQATVTTGGVGKLGKGGGTQGGWPEGIENYKIRFIRLDHGGAGWDDGMDESNADVNFLREFAQATGFRKIARAGESHSIALLRKYPPDGFPPFVYLTGNGGMGRVSSNDVKILRDYCLGGGLLVADAGSAAFHDSFLHFIKQVFPDKPLVDIADDDEIYKLPFTFPDGAPAFWHHGGRRALGIKHEGRWVVFYHPGDMNDAWKSAAYTDVTPEMRASAMHLGINLVRYAFDQWNDAVTKAKK
ncbi:MAG: DUF4159 domain-containing protein, partial [Planctomycetaceae bacterium]